MSAFRPLGPLGNVSVSSQAPVLLRPNDLDEPSEADVLQRGLAGRLTLAHYPRSLDAILSSSHTWHARL